jgi:hypothetical protein
MTAVLFLVCLTLATALGWMTCALATARTVQRAEAWGHRCVAREARLVAEHTVAVAAGNGVLDERDADMTAMAAELATANELLADALLAIVDVTS